MSPVASSSPSPQNTKQGGPVVFWRAALVSCWGAWNPGVQGRPHQVQVESRFVCLFSFFPEPRSYLSHPSYGEKRFFQALVLLKEQLWMGTLIFGEGGSPGLGKGVPSLPLLCCHWPQLRFQPLLQASPRWGLVSSILQMHSYIATITMHFEF